MEISQTKVSLSCERGSPLSGGCGWFLDWFLSRFATRGNQRDLLKGLKGDGRSATIAVRRSIEHYHDHVYDNMLGNIIHRRSYPPSPHLVACSRGNRLSEHSLSSSKEPAPARERGSPVDHSEATQLGTSSFIGEAISTIPHFFRPSLCHRLASLIASLPATHRAWSSYTPSGCCSATPSPSTRGC